MAEALPTYPAFLEKEGPDLASEWEDWLDGLDSMLRAMKIEDNREKFVKFWHYLGKTRKTLKKLDENGVQEEDYLQAKAALTKHFSPERNSIYLLNQLYHMKQGHGESMDCFYLRVKEQMGTLNLQDKSSERIQELLILAQLVNCTHDDVLRTKALRDADLKLKPFLNNARAHEMANRQAGEIGGHVSTETLAFKKHPWKKRPRVWESGVGEQKPLQKCNYCGGSSHPRSLCKARNAVCYRCQVKGHFASSCLKKGVNEVTQSESTETETLQEVFLGALDTDEGTTVSKKIIPILVNGISIPKRVDTGAEATLMDSGKFYELFRDQQLKPARCVFKGPQQGRFEARGYFKAVLQYKDKTHAEDIYVVDNVSCLLSCRASTALGLVKFTCSVITDEFPALFYGLGKMHQVYDIKLKDDATPYAIHTPRRVAHALRPKLEAELNRLRSQGVIFPVEQPTEWCAPIVVVPKPNDSVRLCVDLTKLNDAVLRPRHMLPCVDYVLGQIGDAKVFSKLDANSGFHQIMLTDESKLLTTFITPFGRFAYNRLPFGITSAPEFYQRQVSQILEGLPGVVCLLDDIVISGRNTEEHDARLRATLNKLADAGITLNKAKCEFNKSSLRFLGHILSTDGVQADPQKVSAINNMPIPSDIHSLRRFLGMVNQLGKFTPELATLSKPLRDLLSRKNDWCWGSAQHEAFAKIKEALTDTPVLALYDLNADTKVTSDSSSYGLGAVLMQCTAGQWRPIAYASRSLSETEQRYAQIEKEALSITWACDRFQDYLVGKNFLIETDHKPLVPLLGAKDLDLLPPRIQRFRMRLMRYSYQITHVPGRDLYTADTLSRAPSCDQSPEEVTLESEVTAFVNMICRSMPATDQRLEQIRHHQWEDVVCQEIRQYVQEGWPDRSRVKGIVRKYLPYQAELSVSDDNMLLMGTRILIPSGLRSEMLDRIHEGHQGITKCRELARSSIWWPGISTDIRELVQNCRLCAMKQATILEPLVPSEMPERPWQKVATDLFQVGQATYVVVVDCYSRFLEVAKLQDEKARTVINHIKSIFARHGIPNIVCSDNGPQYTSREFQDFSTSYGFTHVTSSPRHPSGNGEAERAVRTVKDLIKAPDPYIALLNYRNAPIHNGYSPAQLLMSRSLNTKVPILPEKLRAKVPDQDEVNSHETTYRLRMKNNFNQRHGARNLQKLDPGDDVWITDRNETATVQDQANHSRSYIVSTPQGDYRRNRVLLQKLPGGEGDGSSDTINQSANTVPVQPTVPKQSASHETVLQQTPSAAQSGNIPTSSGPQNVHTRSGRQVKCPARYTD